jgi:hypothetical protein
MLVLDELLIEFVSVIEEKEGFDDDDDDKEEAAVLDRRRDFICSISC